jgi:dTDP-4-dehydrorhamnose reductase
VRTQWLYGPRGKHFPARSCAWRAKTASCSVVHDQVGSPTTTLELAPALWDVLRARDAGVYHAACEGQASWFELARATLELAGLAHVPSSPARRPSSRARRAAALQRARLLDARALRGRPLAPGATRSRASSSLEHP